MNEPIDPSLAELTRFLSTDFLPDQPDGGLWKGKKSCVIAIHYLKKQAKRIEELERENQSLADEVRSFGYG